MNNAKPDAGIPVLTEVIPGTHEDDIPLLEPEDIPLLEPESLPEPQAPAIAASLDERPLLQRAVLEWDEDKWDLLEREIRERILYQLMERIDTILEQRVRDSLADVLQTAVEGLASELKDGLQNTMKELVTRAVAQEISNLQNSKK